MAQAAINEAGLLNSMSSDELRVTCERLERSCEDMRSLLNEFVEEQAMLRREQDRLHKRVEKAQKKVGRQENFIDNLISDMEQLEVSNLLSSIFRAKEERKVAKRRRWATKEAAGQAKPLAETEKDMQDQGPFSDDTVRLSWALELQGQRLPELELAGHGVDSLSRWVREVMSGDPVAEEKLPDGWAHMAQRAAEASPTARGSPGSSPSGPGFGFFEANSPGSNARPMRVQRAQRPEFGPDGQDGFASANEENSQIETLLGLVSNVAGHQVAQQMERGFEAAQQLAQQAQRAASKRMDRGEAPAPQSFSRRLQEAGAFVASWSFADWATGGEELEGATIDEVDRPKRPNQQLQGVPSGPSQGPSDSAVLDRKLRKARFQEEFSMYISKTAAPDKSRSARPPVAVAPPRAAASSEDEPPTPPPQPPSREAVLLALQLEEESDAQADEAPEICMVPYGLVAQVTSLTAGCVRLSWLFDWEAAPSDIEAQRGFEVLWCEADSGEEITTQSFERSPAELELPVGSRYRLQVKAVLRAPGGEELWCSSVSAPVSADFRGAERKGPGSSEPSPVPSASATPSSAARSVERRDMPKPKGRVAANFDDFLKRTPKKDASVAKTNAKDELLTPQPSSHEVDRADGAEARSTPSPPPSISTLGPKPKGRVKADFNEFLKRTPFQKDANSVAKTNAKATPPKPDRISRPAACTEDESLAELSEALSSLERAQQASLKPAEVANEGSPSLEQRMAADKYT